MKKKLKLFISVIILTISSFNLHATGYPVFDISGWLTAIDQLYEQYDMVMNSITQIENQYQQIQQAIERAKSIDWENIRFDGDFDIRNDIKDANKRVNQLLTQTRRIKDTLTIQNINCGNGNLYSLADLCGFGDSTKNFATAIEDTASYINSTMKSTIKNIENGLTQQQKEAIWQKYGISPRNYIFAQQTTELVKNSASIVLAKTTDAAIQMKRELMASKTNNIMQAAYSQTDSNGNMTEGAGLEANLHLSNQIIEELQYVQEAINDMATISASKLIQEENQKQIEADEIKYQERLQEAFDYKIPDSFVSQEDFE